MADTALTKSARARALGISRSSLYYAKKQPEKDWLVKCAIEEVLRGNWPDTLRLDWCRSLVVYFTHYAFHSGRARLRSANARGGGIAHCGSDIAAGARPVSGNEQREYADRDKHRV